MLTLRWDTPGLGQGPPRASPSPEACGASHAPGVPLPPPSSLAPRSSLFCLPSSSSPWSLVSVPAPCPPLFLLSCMCPTHLSWLLSCPWPLRSHTCLYHRSHTSFAHTLGREAPARPAQASRAPQEVCAHPWASPFAPRGSGGLAEGRRKKRCLLPANQTSWSPERSASEIRVPSHPRNRHQLHCASP